MSEYETASYAETPGIKDKIYKIAKQQGTNPSWLTRTLVHFALDNISDHTIAKKVKLDPEAKKRAVR